MGEVLYRKFRPKNFSEVIGQDPVKRILKNALKTGRISHAYLFTGPRGVGKTSVARILAKAVNVDGLNKDGDVPLDTDVGKKIEAGNFLDLIEIDAASYTGVDNIREVIEHVKFAPNTGKYKVFIIDEVHMLSKAAFNALLKTLEEPPEHAIFILATTEVHKVPATIVSRTQRFDFRSATMAEILELFDRVVPELDADISKEAQRLIAQAAHGSLRDGLSILDQVMSFSDKEVSLEDVESILGITRIDVHQRLVDKIIKKDQQGGAKMIKDLSFEGKDMVQFLRDFLEYVRLLMLFKMGVENKESIGLLDEEAEVLEKQSKKLSGAELVSIIKKGINAYRDTSVSPVVELPLLTLVLEMTENSSKETKNTDKQTGEKKENIEKDKSKLEAKAESKPKPEEKTDTSKPAENTNKSEIDLGAMVDRWSEVLAKVKQYNHGLITSLRLGRLVKVEEDVLHLAFPYSFHKETVGARKNKIVIEQVLEEVFDKKIQIEAGVEREMDEKPDKTTAEKPQTDDETSKSENKQSGDQQGDDLVGEAMKILGANS